MLSILSDVYETEKAYASKYSEECARIYSKVDCNNPNAELTKIIIKGVEEDSSKKLTRSNN